MQNCWFLLIVSKEIARSWCNMIHVTHLVKICYTWFLDILLRKLVRNNHVIKFVSSWFNKNFRICLLALTLIMDILNILELFTNNFSEDSFNSSVFLFNTFLMLIKQIQRHPLRCLKWRSHRHSKKRDDSMPVFPINQILGLWFTFYLDHAEPQKNTRTKAHMKC